MPEHDEKREKVIRQVQSMLERAELDQEPERSLAATETERLIKKYQLTQQELEEGGRHRGKARRKQEEEEIPSGAGALCVGPWQELESPMIASLITTYFGSTVMCYGGDMQAYVAGPRIAVACDVARYHWLMQRFRELWAAHEEATRIMKAQAEEEADRLKRQQAQLEELLRRPGQPFTMKGGLHVSSMLLTTMGSWTPLHDARLEELRAIKADKPSFYLGLYQGISQSLMAWHMKELKRSHNAWKKAHHRGDHTVCQMVLVPVPRVVPPPPGAGEVNAVAVDLNDPSKATLKVEATDEASLGGGYVAGKELAKKMIPPDPPPKESAEVAQLRQLLGGGGSHVLVRWR